MSWLLNFMQPEIGKPFLFLSATNDIWDAMVKTYSQGVKSFESLS